MSNKLKVNSIIVCVLALLFVFFFDSTKHSPSLSSVNPFAEDPYDAVGSFAFQAAIFLGILSLVRAFRLYRKQQPSDQQKLMVVRTQIAIVLSILVVLAGDMVAMARHFSLWAGTLSGYMLGALVVGFSLLVAVVGFFVRHAAEGLLAPRAWNSWMKPALTSLLFFFVLFFYPESIIESTPGALFTVVVGTALLFMPLWAWGEFLTPMPISNQRSHLHGYGVLSS